MLSHLEIRNYALIDNVTLDFSSGFTTVTGETGAGKSIMLGALSLLCGSRADAKSLSQKGEKTIVEAIFTQEGEETILRREIASGGRSRAFVNDSPVNIQQLAEIGGSLIDIHSQHNNMLLSSPARQLEVIDSMGCDKDLLEKYRDTFRRFVGLRRELQSRMEEISRAREQREFLAFRLENLDRLKPRKGEWEELSKAHDILSDAGEINERLTEAQYLLGAADTSALTRIAEARDALRKVDFSLFENESEDSPAIMQRIENLYVELKDIAETVAAHAQNIEADPMALSRVDERMDALHEAVKRYKVADADALVELHGQLRERMRLIDGGDRDTERLEKEYRSLREELRRQADELTEARTKAAAVFSEELTVLARPLGLSNLRFSAMVSKGKLSVDGQDSVEFLCSFNKNQEMQPLRKVASGGELSRLMLCIKEMTASRMNLPTIIFDEVDTGVSGDIADRMGRMMADMGKRAQIITITHLPQVASRGSEQFRVYKSDTDESTHTHIEKLTESGREKEIAKMLAGSDVTPEALANARALLLHS